METFGRWGSEALEWLRGAVDAVAESDPQVAAAGHRGKPLFSMRGILGSQLRCRKEALHVCSRLAGSGAQRTSSERLDGRKTSKTCCARLRPLLALVVSGRKGE